MRCTTAVFSLALAALLALLARPASAQGGIFTGMQKSVEVTTSSISTTTTSASGAVTKTDSSSVYPSVTLNLDGLLYPGLRLNAGGVFEVNRLFTNVDGTETDSTITKNRPFFLLRSTNPVFSPGIGYFRQEDRARTSTLSDIKLVNDEWAGYLGWNPVGGPKSQFQYLKTHTYDADRTLEDTDKNFGTLVSSYSYQNLGLYYRGVYLDTDDHLHQVDTLQISHGARASYFGTGFKKRLSYDATYNLNYQDLRTTSTSTTGEVPIPVTAFAGLSAITDTPLIVTLSQDPQLIDGDLTAGAGVDLGLPTPPASSQPRNFGLDFLNPVTINRLWLWVDRDLPIDVANSFSWTIYSSVDNVIWTQQSIVTTAPFGPFETRFQIDFPDITARYIKVVTRPLAAVVPESASYPHILVTEVQPFFRQPAGQVRRDLSQTTHVVNADARMRLLDAPALYYEGSYFYNGPNLLGAHTDTLSNGLSANHKFGRMFSAFGRAAREQGTQAEGVRVATVTNATFTFEPASTFRSSVLWSSQDERIAGAPQTRRGIFLQNAAQPYQGIDLLFGAGWNATTSQTGEIAHDRLVNFSASMQPRRHVSVTVNYDGLWSKRSGTYTGVPEADTQRLYTSLAVDPTPTLHLVVGEEVIAITGQNTRTTLALNASWSPFPDGALEFVFAYNDALRPLEYGSDRDTLASVRWNLSRRSYIYVSYQRTRSEFIFQTTESRVLSSGLRLFL